MNRLRHSVTPRWQRRVGTLLLLAVACLFPLTEALAQERRAAGAIEGGAGIEGRWEGLLDVPPAYPEVIVALTRAGEDWSGTFSLPAEGVRDVPLASVEIAGSAMTLRITPDRIIRARFGSSGEARGELTLYDQGDRVLPIRLYREGTPAWKEFGEEREAGREAREAALAEHRPPLLVATERGPAADRVHPAALERLLQDAADSHSTALVVMHRGEVVGSWHGGGESRRIEAMSVTKSIVNLAVGRLVTLGVIESLDTPVKVFFPQWREGEHAGVTIRHLLNHTSGLDSPMPTGPIYDSGDFVRFALDSELVSEPGAEFSYNNSATNLLAGLVGVAAGERMDRFIGRALFAPLGITDFTWTLDDSGNPHGMSGLQIHPRDLALVGQLVLQRGEWDGERLIEDAWFTESFTADSDPSGSSGLLWWLVHEEGRLAAVRADGYLGQYLVVYPEKHLVGVRMIEGFPGYDGERDGFRAFQERLGELVP